MKAVVLDAPKRWRVADVPDPTPSDDEVVVAVSACGVCGTDRHLFEGEFPAAFPLIPGHELAGKVVAVGKQVRHLKVGDFIVVHPNKPCRTCLFCREGDEHLCENLQAYGIHLPGGFAQFVAVRAENVHPAEGLTPLQAAWAEPLSCCLHGLRKVGVRTGERVLVLGCGPMGLLFVQLALLHGAAVVVAVDGFAARKEAAKKVGATWALMPNELEENGSDIAPGGFSLVIEASGNPQAVAFGLRWVRAGGRFLQFGVCPMEAAVSIAPFVIYRRELMLVGSFSLNCEMPAAIELLRSGRLNVSALTTHQLPLEGYGDALQLMREGRALKVQLLPDGRGQ